MTEYQPKHLAPSLDYEAWITDLKADEDAALFRERLAKVGAGVEPLRESLSQMAEATERFGQAFRRVSRTIVRTMRAPAESRAGHEWTSRSWFQ